MNTKSCSFASAWFLQAGTRNPAACAIAAVLLLSSKPLTAADAPVEEPPVLLEAFNVSGGKPVGYGVSAFSSATRLKTAILDVPQSVSVVTAKLLEDIGAIDYTQAVTYVPGVSYRQNVNDGSIIRGFNAFNVYRNGFRVTGYVSDNANLERIEIIKGPSAAIAGASESGGLVNRITKKPLDKKHLSLRTIVGNHGLLRGEVDTGGPVTAAGNNNLDYRFILSGQTGGDWRVGEKTRKIGIYPSLNWRISQKTNLLVELEYLDAVTPSNEGSVYLPFLNDRTTNGIPIAPGAIPKVSFDRRWAPTSFNTNDRKLEGRDQKAANAFVTLTHAFSENISARQTFMSNSVDIDTPKVRAGHAQYIGTDGGLYVPRSYQLSYTDTDLLAAQGDLVFSYGFSGTRHQTLVGYEWTKTKNDNRLFLGSIPDISVYEPDYDVPLGAATLSTDQLSDGKSFSYFINHQSHLWDDRIILTGGIRRDTASASDVNDRKNNRISKGAKPADLDSPMYGITIKPTRWLAFYGVYSEAGAPRREVRRFPNIPATDPRQETFFAESVRTNEEFGVKAEIIDGRFSIALAHFDTLDNDATRGDLDFNAPGGTKTVLETGNRAQGWELEFYGNPIEKLSIIGGFSRVDTSTAEGLELRGVPRDKLSFFAAYDLRGGSDDGFRVKGGLTYQTDVAGRSENNFRNPGGFNIDVGLDYTYGPWTFGLNVNNLTDEVLPVYAISQSSNTVTPPRSFLFSVRRVF